MCIVSGCWEDNFTVLCIRTEILTLLWTPRASGLALPSYNKKESAAQFHTYNFWGKRHLIVSDALCFHNKFMLPTSHFADVSYCNLFKDTSGVTLSQTEFIPQCLSGCLYCNTAIKRICDNGTKGVQRRTFFSVSLLSGLFCCSNVLKLHYDCSPAAELPTSPGTVQ